MGDGLFVALNPLGDLALFVLVICALKGRIMINRKPEDDIRITLIESGDMSIVLVRKKAERQTDPVPSRRDSHPELEPLVADYDPSRFSWLCGR